MIALQLAVDAAGNAPNTGYLAWGIALLALTIILIAIEFAVPSGGLIALLSGVACIGSIISFFMYDSMLGVISIFGYLILGPIIVIYGFRLWLSSPLAGRMILGGTAAGDANEDGIPDDVATANADREMARELIGAIGVTATALRPVGVVVIGGRRIDALAESGIIDADTPIEVTEVYDNQIKVRPRRD